jgi:preprotein translocase subunit SecG
METMILVVHVLASISLVFFIILQQGKGSQVGVSFNSGASQTVFGSQSSTGFLTKLITLLACIFFATNLSLAFIAKKNSKEQFEFTPTEIEHKEIQLKTDSPLDLDTNNEVESTTNSDK